MPLSIGHEQRSATHGLVRQHDTLSRLIKQHRLWSPLRLSRKDGCSPRPEQAGRFFELRPGETEKPFFK